MIGLELLEPLGRMLADLGIGASLVDRELRMAWCNDYLKAQAPEMEACGGGMHCFAVQWGRGTRCADCLPLLVFQTGEPREGYRERRRHDSPAKVYRVRAVPVQSESRVVTHVLETFVDVTNLGRAVGVARLESQLSSSLAAAGRGVFVLDPRRRIVSWSPGMEAILDITVADVLGRDASRLFPDEAWRTCEPLLCDGDIARAETELLAKDGRIVPVAISSTPIRDPDGELCGYQTVVEDLSEVCGLRRRVKRSERTLGEIVRASTDIIFTCDETGHITTWNRGATASLGYEPEEAAGMTLLELCEDERVRELYAQVQSGAVPRLRQTFVHRDGTRVSVEVTASALEDEAGRFAGLSLIGRDMTDRDRLEQQMVRSEKLAAVGSLAAGLAHEIGSPLNVISACAEYVLAEVASVVPRRAELQTILDEVDRIRRLVSDLLGFARGGARKEGKTDLRAAVDRVLRLIRIHLDRRGIQLSVDCPETIPPVAAAPDAVHQLLLNVLMNATAAVRDGGRIAIEIREHAVPGGAPGVSLCIDDDGPGIPPALRQRAFDPFFTTRPDGTGLGLTVCNRIVMDHGGTIHIEESPLRGARIAIALPAALELSRSDETSVSTASESRA